VYKCYSETINNIRSSIKNHNIWILIDETTDCEERYIDNVIGSTLQIERLSQIFLLYSKVFPKDLHTIIKLQNNIDCKELFNFGAK